MNLNTNHIDTIKLIDNHSSLVQSPNGNIMLKLEKDGSVNIINAHDKSIQGKLEIEKITSIIYEHIQFSSEDKYISRFLHNTCYIYNQYGKCVYIIDYPLKKSYKTLKTLAFSSDNTSVAIGMDNVLTIWQLCIVQL